MRLLYDFNVVTGDTLNFELFGYDFINDENTIYPYPCIVDSVTTITVNNLALKRVHTTVVADFDFFPNRYIYTERIGSERRIFEDKANGSWVADAGPSQLRCYIDNEIEYHTWLYDWLNLDNCEAENPNATFETNGDLTTINIHPNPASNFTQISIKTTLPTAPVHIEIINLAGQIVYSKNAPFKFLIKVETSSIPSGIYFIKMQMKNAIWTERLIIQH